MSSINQKKEISAEASARIRRAMVNEVTEYHIYKHLSRVARKPENKVLLNKIADEELEHYRFWMQYSDEVEPQWWKVKLYIIIGRLFGLVYSVKLMERSESLAQKEYSELAAIIPGVSKIIDEESNHEKKLLDLLNDWRLKAFGTWLIAANLVLFVSVGLVAALATFAVGTKYAAVMILFSTIVVSLSDFLNTYLMKTQGKLRMEPFKKALVRLISGCIIGAFVALPFFVSPNLVPAVIFSLIVIMVLAVMLNFYHSVVSDFPIVTRIMRILFSYFIITVLVIASGLIFQYFSGV